MQDTFITKIRVDKVRHLQNFDILLSEMERKHLILTGQNGSGKTSLLEAIRDSVVLQQREKTPPRFSTPESEKLHDYLYTYVKIIAPQVEISFSQNVSSFLDVMFAYIPAVRNKLETPKAIEPIDITCKTVVTRNASKDFLKYMLGLDYRLYGAKNDGNNILETRLEKWFDSFQKALREIYNCDDLKLKRDTKNLKFIIDMVDREPFGLHEMADGYAAFLDIYMELLMRFESADAVVEYNQPAIVMIDEIETHLHVELQKRVLPFLTKMFPNVQFIVSTHSPFVMTSLKNAIVYDLESNVRLETPSFYAYSTIVETFLNTSMYSFELKKYFERYKELCLKERTAEEHEEFLRIKAELEIKSIPSTELYFAFQEIEKNRKADKNGSSI